MNELYGVDPSAPSNALELGFLLRLFDVGEGRFIAEFPVNWLDDLRRNLAERSDLGAMRGEEAKTRIRHALLPASSRYVPGLPWIENADKLRQEVKMLIGASGCPPSAEPLPSVIASPDSLPDSRADHIPRTAGAYAKAARPLFFTSPVVCLVDPYFRLRHRDRQGTRWTADRRRSDVLRALLQNATESKRFERFRLTVSRKVGLEDDESGTELIAAAYSIAEEAGLLHIDFEFDVIEDIAPRHDHPRYLLGTRSGLQFDYGFDTSTDGKLNHVHWMSRAELDPLLKVFMNAPARTHRNIGAGRS
ncbi:hypothetical protein [Caenimonas sp. SL110]|uniref:hypothetical protein n=1 Tax=Caenimonas sp. SL110 TaxID=1450524 RepID=UPI00128DDB66|nr:hypothetical protein [Caenimonas sp. SL110]